MTTPTTTNKSVKLDDLIESGDLWVKNTTDAKSRRVICINYVNRGGHVKTELIPNTPHPIHLSNRMTKDMLRESSDLRRYVTTKALTIIDPEQAEKYYEQKPMALDAVNHAYAKILNAPSPIPRPSMIKTDPNASAKQLEQNDDDGKMSSEIKTQSHLQLVAVKPQVQVIVAGYNNKEKARPIDEVMMDLMNIDLTEEDLRYMINHTIGALHERAKEMLDDLI